MTHHIVYKVSVVLFLVCVFNFANALSWHDFVSPININPSVIVTYSNGCLLGAAAL